MRNRRHVGMLKGEEMHELARDISHGKCGEINLRYLVNQCNSYNCLTLTMACKILWNL